MINPEFIQTFLTLAETKHFTETAKRLHMTQPGVSQHLRRLEEYFGTALIHKQGKSFTLTDAGKKLAGYGQDLFHSFERFREQVGVDDPHAGTVKFGCPGSFGIPIFDLLLESAKKYKNLRVELMVAPTHSIVGLLKEEHIDVGFMTEEPKDAGVESQLFAREELLLALPKTGKKPKTYEELKQLGFVNHPDGFHNATRLLGKNFPTEFQGMESFPIRVFINQNNRILDPVAAGLGFAIVPSTTCRHYPDRNRLQFMALPKKVEDPIYKVIRKGEKLPSRYTPLLSKLSVH